MSAWRGDAGCCAPPCSHRKGLEWAFRALLLGALIALPTPAVSSELKEWSGGPPPALDLTGLDGRRYRLEDLRGKVVLVNFWATWCVPCRDEMPSIERLERRLAGRPFVALVVNLDEPEARIRKFVSQTRLNLAVLLDPGRKAARAWNARILPASFIVAPGGAVRYSVVGEIDWADEGTVKRIVALFPPDP